jgi:TetR/AcrR family transcriptional repressor of nem operon
MRTAELDSPTRDKLLDAAEGLMLSKGFTATSVDDVCRAAGLTKGSFFHYFDSKEHLGRVVVERFYRARQKMIESAPFRAEPDPLQRVLRGIDFFIEMGRSAGAVRGCLLGTFAQELSATHPGIRAVCADCFADHVDCVRRDLEAAKAMHAPRADWSPQALAEHMLAVLQGSLILAKAKQDFAVVESNLRHFQDYVRRLFGCEPSAVPTREAT